jgi:hypothetical protein
MNTPKILPVFCISLLAIMACNLPGLAAVPTEAVPVDQAPDRQLEATAFPSSPPPIPAEATEIPSSTPQIPKIVLIGFQSLALGEAANFIQNQGGFVVSVNEVVPSADLLLFTINAPDGPMPDTVRQIQDQQGQTVSRAAILLINTDLQPDAELEQLVLLEVREMLYRFIAEDQVNRLEILRMPAPDLGDKLRALLILPPANIQINAPTQ